MDSPRKSKTLDKSLRQKYAPWGGGQYGGNLVFEHENRRYRVERSFALTPKGDSFTLIELGTNKKSARFPEELGEALFGLDADSFERSVYLPQQRIDGPLATDSIQAKLSGLVEDSTDVGNYEKAVAALRAKRSELLPYRGNGGSAAETAAKITKLQLQLDEALAQEEKLEHQQAVAAQTQQKAEALRQRLDETEKMLDAASRNEKDSLLQQQYAQLQQRHRKTSEQVAQIRKKYRRGLPEEETLHRAETAGRRLAELKECPNEEQLQYCRGISGRYTQLREEIRDLQLQFDQLRQIPNVPQRFAKLTILWLVVILALAGGIALLYLHQQIYAMMAIAVAAAVLTAGIVLAIIRGKKKKDALTHQRQREARLANLQQQLEQCERAAGKCRGELAAFLSGAQLHDPETALLQLERQGKEKRDLMHQLSAFFEELGLSDTADFQSAIKQLREDMIASRSAKILLRELEAQLEEMESTCGEVLFADLSDGVDRRQLRAQEQQLRAALTETTSLLLQLQQQIRLLRQHVEAIPQLRASLEEHRRTLAQMRENIRLLDATIAFMQQAKENLATAYLETIRARFAYYLAELAGDSEEFLIDPDLKILLERRGSARELAYFSAGQTDLVLLCMRLALADALFRDQQMFVILDDPFVNLDDAHMALAMSFLKQVSSDRQILYLTCHSGRVP